MAKKKTKVKIDKTQAMFDKMFDCLTKSEKKRWNKMILQMWRLSNKNVDLCQESKKRVLNNALKLDIMINQLKIAISR